MLRIRVGRSARETDVFISRKVAIITHNEHAHIALETGGA
jgi:hypothetical protein